MPQYKITLPDGTAYRVTAPSESAAYLALQQSLAPKTEPAEQEPEQGRGGVLPSLAEGFATSFTGIPLGIAGIFTARPEETAAGKFSLGAEKVIQETLGIDPTKEATTAEAVAGGLGSLASFLVPGTAVAKGAKALGAGAKAATTLGLGATALQASPLSTTEGVQRIMAREAATGEKVSDEARLESQRLNAIVGLSELVPLRRFMGPLEAILARVPIAKAGGVGEIVETSVKRALRSATEEGAQEALAQGAQNLIEQGYYNPDLDITEGLLSSAGVGGAAGGTLDVILQLMAGRKASKMRTAFTQLERENARQAAEKAPERIRADALAGREQLLRNAPSGEISITSADNTETGFKYKVVDASGKAAATFDTRDAAFLAAEQYEQDNPGAVTFIRPTIAEAARTTKGKPTKQEKKRGKKIAQQLKAEGALQPAPAQLPTTPAGQATTGAAISETVQQVGATPTQAAEIVAPAAPKKGRKKRIAPVEAPVPEGIAAPPPVSTTAAEIPAPKTYGEVAKKSQVGHGIRIGDFEVDFYTGGRGKGDVPYARIRSVSRKPIYKDATGQESEVLDVWGVEDPNVEEPRTGPKAGINEVDKYVPAPFRQTMRDWLSGKIDQAEAEKRIKATPIAQPAPTRKLSAVPTPTAPQATPTAAPVSPTEAPPAAVQAQPAPKPPREFKPSVRALFKPVVTSPDGMRKLQEFEAKKDEVSKALNARLAPIVGSQARVQLVDVVRQGKGIAEGEVLPAGDVIYLSYNLYDPNLTVDQMVDKLFDVMNHEVIHSLSNLGLFRGNELPTLFKAAERIKYQGNQFTYYDRALEMYKKVEGYRNPDGSLNEEMVHEEAVAEMFRDARAGKLKLEGTPKGVFGRIVEFFKRLFNGYRDAKVGQIFKDIEAGKMGAREARAVEGGVQKLAILAQPGSDSTQVATTTGSYRKAAAYIKETIPNAKNILDYGAGRGLGSDAMRQESGVRVDSYEPIPSNWQGKAPLNFNNTDQISEKYDGVVNLNVLNVLEPKLREEVVRDIVSKIAPGGAAVIGVRKFKGDIEPTKNSTPAQEEKAIWVKKPTGLSYQKGFDGNELVDYLKGIVPPGYTVERGPKVGATSAVIRAPKSDARKFSVPAQLTGESEQEFARWFKQSKAVDGNGMPQVFYHGRPRPLREGQFNRGASGALPGEEGPYFFSTSKRFAEDYALFDRSKFSSNIESETGVMYPVYLSVQNPFDYESASDMRNLAAEIKRLRPDGLSMVDMFGKNGETMLDTPKERASESFRFFENLDRGSWRQMENPIVQRAIRNLGYDGFYLRENAYKNLAVYKPEQIKSIYNQFEPGTAESRKLSVIPPYPDDTTSTVYIREAGPAARLKPSGKVTVGEIAKAFDAITGKSDITDPADYNRIVNAIVDEVEYQKRQAQSGVGWYDNDVDLVFKILSETFPQFSDPFYGAQNRQLFTIIAGVMSNGMKARPNVTMAAINFANYMNTGKFSEIHPFTGKGWNQRTNIMSGQIRMLNSMMADPMFNVPAGSNMTREERFLEWIFSEHPVREINQMRARHGVKSPAKIGGVDTMRLGAYAFGPKFGPFILNLNGRTDETVDSWASRSFYRHMGRLLAKNGKKTNDAPITGADREAMKRALRDIADKTNLSSRDVQAVLWFYEKALYNDLGMKIPLEVFSDGARDYVNQFGKGKANDPTADDRTRAIARAGEAAGTRTTAPTPGGVAESEAVAQELKIANEIAENAAKTGEASQAEADVANQAVRDAVRKLSTIPQPAPLPAAIEEANKRIFAGTRVPMTPGEKVMGALGGLGREGFWGRFADEVRVNFVQKSGQIQKKQRELFISGKLNREDAAFAEMDAVAADDMYRRASHYTVEIAHNGAPVIRGLDVKRNTVLLREGGDPNSAHMYVESDQRDSLFKVLEMLIGGGPNGTDVSDAFRSYAIAMVSQRRLAEGKDIPEDITPEYIEQSLALAEQYPIIKEAFEMYQRFNTKLIEAVRDSGYLSQELFEEFTDQQNYYSMYRQLEEGDVVQELSGGLGSRIRFKAYEGSLTGNLMADPIVAMLHNTSFWTNVILRTIATQKAYRVGILSEVVKRLRPFEDEEGNVTIETPSRAEGYDPRVFYTYINGQEIAFASKDPLFTIGLSGNDFVSPGTFFEFAGMPADWLREAVTRDPGFMFANLLRDSVSTWVLAGSGANPLQTFRGFVSALRSSSSFEALRSYGVVGSFDEAQKPAEKIVRGMRQKLTKVQGLPSMTSTLKGAWNKLGSWSEASDAATRIAVYEAAKRDGATDFTAAYRALSIMNFSRSGHSAGLRMWTRMVPFLNARIQGFDVLYTGLKAATGVLTGRDQLDFERQRGTHVLIRGMALTAAAMGLSLLLEDDEDYQELPPYIKDANILIPIPGQKGQYFQIPKPFEAGFLFMTVPQAFYDVAMGNRSMRSATKLMFNQFSSTFGFNPIPQAALPIVENMINRDFYTGQPLISTGMQQLDPSLQYSPSTSYVARGLSQLSSFLPLNYNFEEGRFVPISPIMLDNLITGYGGPIVSYIAMAAGGMTYAFGSDNQGLPVAGSQLPVIRRFFVDARDRQPQAATEAYELYQLVDKTNRTISRLKKMGDTEALREYREENINILRVGKEVRRMADNLNNIRAQIRRLEADKVTPMSEKLDKLRELRSRELRVTRRIDEINQKLGR